MIIVVEGSDNAGKTTLALRLAKLMKAVYVKSENIPPEAVYLPQYHSILEQCQKYGNGIVISDRHHAVSDPIFGAILRGGTKLLQHEITRYLDQVAAFVYCRPDFGTITRTMFAREQMLGVDRHIGRIVETYDKFFAREGIRERTWKYDWTKDNEQLLIEEIRRHA